MYTKVDKLLLAQANKYNVFGCLLKEGPINRAAIAKRTDLSVPTVMAITGELIEKGFVHSIGKGESSAGKPPEMLEVVQDAFYTLGVDLGRTAIRIVVNDALSHQAFCHKEATGDPFPADNFIARLEKLMLRIIKPFQKGGAKILGAGIAMPGLIESGTGLVINSPDFGWREVALQETLVRDLPFPVMVRNSNHALALNENGEDGDGYKSTFCINLGYGIGAALIIGDELYSGAGGASGELGHSVVEKDGPLCKCGNFGCLEAVASGEAIARQAQALVAHHSKSKMAELCGGDPAKLEACMVFEAAAAGDESAEKILGLAADYIGIGLSTAVNVLDPDRVILCGGLMKNGPAFFDRIKARMDQHVMPRPGRHLNVMIGTKGEYSAAHGACKVLINSFWAERALPI
jgi:predicted NBD/HSP70 family sugar kinase